MPSSTPAPTVVVPLSGAGGGIITWASWERNDWQLYAVNADGSGLRRLINNIRGGYEPQWSADGLQLVYQYNGLFIFDLASGEISRLPLQGGSPDLPNEYLVKPSWSPDGQWIAFINESGFLGDTYLVRADGSGLTRLTWTNDISRDGNLVWSPDGSRIAYSAERNGNIDVYVSEIQASLQGQLTSVQLTDGPGSSRNLVSSWSPDGSRLAFSSDRENSSEIYVMNADGSGVTRLTNNRFLDMEPSWSPNGRMLAFTSNRDGNMEIYILDVEETILQGEGVPARRLTDHPGDDVGPVWKPIP